MSRPSRHGILALAAVLGGCDDGLVSSAPEPATARAGLAADRGDSAEDPASADGSPPPDRSTAAARSRRTDVDAASRPDALAEPPSEPSDALRRWTSAAAVSDDAFARRVFFSWTSTSTAARLRRDRELFDDGQLPEGPTAYVQRLEHVAARDDASGRLAQVLLGHPDLARRRYAWVRPWATRMGIVREYGDQLIAIVLRPDALVGRFDPGRTDPWQFHDLDERVVPLARVLADPSRIGAIHHVRRDDDPTFREYVICNESAIESWSLATPQVVEALAADAAAVRELAAVADAGPPAGYEDIRAFSVDHYAPTPANLSAIADALTASVQHGKPLRVQPRRRFRADAAPGLVRIRELPALFLNVI